MQKLFEFSYVMDREETSRKLFINIELATIEGNDAPNDHLFQISSTYGTMDEDGHAIPIALVNHAIVSDDAGMTGIGDEKGSTDLPVFLIFSQSNMNGKLEGVLDVQLITQMGDDVLDITTMIGDITAYLNLSHKAFMLNASSLYEEFNASKPFNEFAELVKEIPMIDVISTYMTFFIASLHPDQEKAHPFIRFLEKSQAFCHKDDNKVAMKVLD